MTIADTCPHLRIPRSSFYKKTQLAKSPSRRLAGVGGFADQESLAESRDGIIQKHGGGRNRSSFLSIEISKFNHIILVKAIRQSREILLAPLAPLALLPALTVT